jgi:hypothetical protein
MKCEPKNKEESVLDRTVEALYVKAERGQRLQGFGLYRTEKNRTV